VGVGGCGDNVRHELGWFGLAGRSVEAALRGSEGERIVKGGQTYEETQMVR
jgi:hypothetical protein